MANISWLTYKRDPMEVRLILERKKGLGKKALVLLELLMPLNIIINYVNEVAEEAARN